MSADVEIVRSVLKIHHWREEDTAALEALTRLEARLAEAERALREIADGPDPSLKELRQGERIVRTHWEWARSVARTALPPESGER